MQILGNIKGRIKNIMSFKKPAFWVVTTAVIVCIAVASLLLANPAKTPELPEAASVLSMDMEQFNEYESLGAVTVTDSGDIKTVLSALSGAGKTLRHSVNDYPARNNYLVVRINLSGEQRTLCLYTEGNVYYIEEPYVGIYRSTRDASVAIYKIYTGSGGVKEPDQTVDEKDALIKRYEKEYELRNILDIEARKLLSALNSGIFGESEKNILNDNITIMEDRLAISYQDHDNEILFFQNKLDFEQVRQRYYHLDDQGKFITGYEVMNISDDIDERISSQIVLVFTFSEEPSGWKLVDLGIDK